MKIFFTASRGGFVKYKKNYDLIIKHLTSAGHTVYEDIMEYAAAHKKYTNFEERYKKVNFWIKNADIVIAEISTPSTGVGHEIYQALNINKQVLVLVDENAAKDQAATLRGNPSRNIVVKEYNTDVLSKTIDSFIGKAKSNLDTKFILIISPEIDKYLKWSAENKRMHKAQVVRRAIDEMMKKDKDYKSSQNPDFIQKDSE